MEHVMLFGDIANNMMFDGWIAIGVCVIMIVVGWTVAIKKFFYLNKIEKGNKEFLQHWKTHVHRPHRARPRRHRQRQQPGRHRR